MTGCQQKKKYARVINLQSGGCAQQLKPCIHTINCVQQVSWGGGRGAERVGVGISNIVWFSDAQNTASL